MLVADNADSRALIREVNASNARVTILSDKVALLEQQLAAVKKDTPDQIDNIAPTPWGPGNGEDVPWNPTLSGRWKFRVSTPGVVYLSGEPIEISGYPTLDAHGWSATITIAPVSHRFYACILIDTLNATADRVKWYVGGWPYPGTITTAQMDYTEIWPVLDVQFNSDDSSILKFFPCHPADIHVTRFGA
jgi:hypothetical protein